MGKRLLEGLRRSSAALLFFVFTAQPLADLENSDEAGTQDGEQGDIVFTEYSPLTTVGTLLDRFFSPLRALHVRSEAARKAKTLDGQPIDLARERFATFVPRGPAPQHGYGLLVFIPPWDGAAVPGSWIAALEKHRIIFVSAANSGNEEDVLDRRVPLALLGAYNMMQRYPIDADRIYIGGFSGGSRVALRVAVAFPDLFHGVLLNAGSDPLGDELIPIPEAARFEEFRTRTRLALATGQRDDFNLGKDAQSLDSFQDWCVFGSEVESMPFVAHDLVKVSALNRALNFLDQPLAIDTRKLSTCEQGVQSRIDASLADVDADLAKNRIRAASDRLNGIDLHFGGLAVPRSIELLQKIEALAP